MAFRLLLTDTSSALGEAICRGFEDYSAFSVVTPPVDFDWRNTEALRHVLEEHDPGLVINTLVFSGVAPEVNRALAESCHERGLQALHLSSYRVFGTGTCEQDEGLSEADVPAPDDERGRDLLSAEEAFLGLRKSLILRVPWLMEPYGHNVLTRVVERLACGDVLEASDSCRGCPVTVDDVRRVVVAMVLQIFCGAENWGMFHLHTSDSCSEAEFADYIARLLEKEGHQPGPVEILRNREYPLMPGCGLLTGTRCMNNFGIQLPSWRQGVAPLVREWLTAWSGG